MGKTSVEILTNGDAISKEVSNFIDIADNGTLYHRPEFLAYHAQHKLAQNGIEYQHFLFRRRSKLIGFFPGAIVRSDDGVKYQSPWGASIGGLAVHPNAKFSEIDDMVSTWLDLVNKQWGVVDINLTLAPHCFQRGMSQDTVEYALRLHGFQYSTMALMMVAHVSRNDDFPEAHLDDNAKRRLRQSLERGCSVRLCDDRESFWSLLTETMQRHGNSPTHTEDELENLMERLPGVFHLHMAYHGSRPVAGMLLFDVTSNASTTFYICSRPDAQELRPVNLLTVHVLRWARQRGLKWLDFGPSTFGLEPHTSLIRFKEQHAARGMLRRTMKYEFANKQQSVSGLAAVSAAG